jgi:hypothetical protein
MVYSTYQLAQVNIGRMRAPLDSSVMAGFVNQLEAINALADRSEGFVWRLQSENGDATALRPWDDDMMIINMSVWEDFTSLQRYVYKSSHAEVMRHRREWFERFEGVYMALWWVPQGHIPDPNEAKERLAYLEAHGPTEYAFTFRDFFLAPRKA